MMNTALTVLVALAKIGGVYARTRQKKQLYQSATILLIMIIVIKNENSKSKKKNKYNRYYDERSRDEF